MIETINISIRIVPIYSLKIAIVVLFKLKEILDDTRACVYVSICVGSMFLKTFVLWIMQKLFTLSFLSLTKLCINSYFEKIYDVQAKLFQNVFTHSVILFIKRFWIHKA